MYKCKICDKVFLQFVLLEGHFAFSKKCRSKQELLECYICQKRFQHSATLKYHLTLHSTYKRRSYKRSIYSNTQIVNDQNQKSHHQDIAESNCTICGKSFRSKFVLQRHLIEHNNINVRKSKARHATASISSVLFRCKVCKILLGSRKRLATHMHVHANGTIKCEICQIKFTEKSLRWHNKLSHPHLIGTHSISKPLEHNESRNGNITSGEVKVNVKRPKASLECQICHIICENRKRLDCHLKVHVDGQFKCEICQIWFTRRSLEMHEQRLHPNVRKKKMLEALQNRKPKPIEMKRKRTNYTHQCSVCKLLFMNEKQWANHTRIHIDGDVECEICRIRFTKRSLEMHMRRRHAELLTQQIISKALERNNIKQHSEINEKKTNNRYQCSVCKLLFINTTALDTHMRVHINGDVECKIGPIRLTKSTTYASTTSLHMNQRRRHPDLRTKPIISKSNAIKQHNKHEITQHSEELPEANTNAFQDQYMCDLCHLYCYTAKRLETHQTVHSVGNMKCEICQVMFTEVSLVKHKDRSHPGWRKQSILKAVEKVTVPEIHKAHQAFQHSEELPEENTTAFQDQYLCDLCHLYCYTAKRLETHKIVHSVGNMKCEICQVMFTEVSLVKHKDRAHSGWREQSVLKVVEKATVPEMHNKHQASQQSEELELVEPVDYAKQLVHQCDHCHLFCQTKGRLEQHKLIHTLGNLKCDICQVMFTQKSLAKHKDRAHPGWRTQSILKAVKNTAVPEMRSEMNEKKINYRYQCSLCKLLFTTTTTLDNHMRVHTHGDVKCKICRIRFTKRSLAIHERRRHPELRSKQRSEINEKKPAYPYAYQCSLCKLFFLTTKMFDTHMKIHTHGDVECKICRIRFTKHSLAIHERRRHPELKTKSLISKREMNVTAKRNEISEKKSPYRYQCSVCKLMFIATKVLDAHMRVHIDGNVKCKVCHIRFTKRSLFLHERRSHPELQTKPTISKSLETDVNKQHNTHETSQHSEELPQPNTIAFQDRYLCDICHLYCYSARRLETHKMVHSDGNVKCEVCQLMFTEVSLAKHKNRAHPGWRKQCMLKAGEKITEMHNEHQASHQSEELLEPIDYTVQFKHQCDLCHLFCQSNARLEQHKLVHTLGNLKCDICQVMFTEKSLAKHKDRSHPGWRTQCILKAVENTTVPEMFGKKQASMTDFYAVINKRRHTVHIGKAIKLERPATVVSRRLSEYRAFHKNVKSRKCEVCDKVLRTQELLNNHTKSHFQCYICKKYFETMSHLSPHLKRHILYQKWVDPLNVRLSNWTPTESREILENQPLVLVNNLDIKNIDLKSLAQYDQRIQNGMNNSNGQCSINDPESTIKNEYSLYIVEEDILKRESNGTYAEEPIDLVSNLPMNNNAQPISQELSDIVCVDNFDDDSLLVETTLDCVVDDTTVIDISSGDESDVEEIDNTSEKYFCYFCERLFRTCDALGLHMEICTMK